MVARSQALHKVDEQGRLRWNDVRQREAALDAAKRPILPVEIRPGEERDLRRIDEIYSHYVEHDHATFDLTPPAWAARREWFSRFGTGETDRYRLWVATIDGGEVVGYATSLPFRPKAAYQTSVETTVYLAPGRHGQGWGSALYRRLLESLRGAELHRAYGGITLPNPASIRLHEKFEFQQVAHYREVGWKFDRYWDVVWFERSLP